MSGTVANPIGITNPPIDDLLQAADSKYALVIYSAKRARQINAYYSQLQEGLLDYVGPLVETEISEKPLSIALREINQGLVTAEAAPRSDRTRDRSRRRVVLGVGGGIAAYKAALLLRLFTESGHDVTVVPTAAALRFVGAPTWEALSGKPVSTEVWSDVPRVPHVQIGKTADLVVVAPATADLLARAAAGLADDLLTTTLLTAHCPVVFAPAMHTEMWDHPANAGQRRHPHRPRCAHRPARPPDGSPVRIPAPGGWPKPEEIFAVCQRSSLQPQPSADALPTRDRWRARRVVVSAGGTREPLDPVRYLGNRSSGKQGYALAQVAAARGAPVTLVAANTRSRRRPASTSSRWAPRWSSRTPSPRPPRTPTSSSWRRRWPTSGPRPTRRPRSRRPTPPPSTAARTSPRRPSSWSATPTSSPAWSRTAARPSGR